jgi:hypothetical protein
MEIQRQTVNAPQRDLGESMLISVVIGAAAYFAFYIVGAWCYLKIPVFDFSHAVGFLMHWTAHSFGFSPSDDILGVHAFSTWPASIIEKADTLGAVVFYCAAGAGMFLGHATSAPPPAEILIRGREITNNAGKVQAELGKEGKADGLCFHPALALTQSRERQHALILGQTGAGKTQILLPIIGRAVNRGDRALIFDYKGDLTATTTERVAIIAPWDSRGWAWDIAQDVRNKQDARAFAAALIQETGKDPFWSNGARSLLVAMLVKLQVERGQAWTWGELAELVPADLDKLYFMVRDYNPEGLAAVEEASKTTQSLRMTLASFLSSLFDLADAWDGHPEEKRVSFRRWMIDPPAHYPRNFILQGNIAYEPLMKSYIQGILRAVQQIVGDPSFSAVDHKIWVFLDEFIQLGKLETLLPLLEVARGKGVRVVLAAQDFARISEVYGDQAARALMGTVATKIFGMTSGTSAQDYSDLIGDQELKVHSITFSSSRVSTGGTATSGNQSTSYQTEKRPAFAASQFGTDLGQRLVGGKWYSRAVFFTGGQNVGVLDWPRVIWPETRAASEPAEWLTPGWPHRVDAFIAAATEDGTDDEGREAGGSSGGRSERADDLQNKPAATPPSVTERVLPTDKAPEENPLEEAGKQLNEKINEDLSEEPEPEADAGDALGGALGGLGDLVHIAEMLHKVTEAVGALSGQATPGQAQAVHVAKDDEEEEERKLKRRREQQRQAAAEAARQLDDGREDDR